MPLAKAAMFLAAGNLILATGSNQITALAGISRFLPVSLFSFGLAGVSLMGMPPSGGFAAKWMLLQASLGSGQWWWILVLIVGSLFSAVYVFQVYQASFVENTGSDNFHRPSLSLEVTPLLLALMALGLALVAEPVLSVMALPLNQEGCHDAERTSASPGPDDLHPGRPVHFATPEHRSGFRTTINLTAALIKLGLVTIMVWGVFRGSITS